MGLLEIRLFGDPVLRQQAREVTDHDDRLAQLAADMHETMLHAEGVGLAAPQVGVLKRLFTWQVEEHGGAVVNPRLTDTSSDVESLDEGCLSFPGLFYPVDRPLHVEVAYEDITGEQHEIGLDGFLARVWLHEMDHLNGILFIDHLAKHDRREAMRRMRQVRGEPEPPRRGPGSLLLGRRD